MLQMLVFLEDKDCYLLNDKILVDKKDLCNIFGNKFVLNPDRYTEINGKFLIQTQNSYVEFEKILFNETFNDIEFVKLKEGDYYDYRKNNIKFIKKQHKFKAPEIEGITILEHGDPYYITEGKYSGQFRNMYWLVRDINNNEYYLMNCKNGDDYDYIKFSKQSLNKVLKIGDKRNVWYIGSNGYVATTFKEDNIRKIRYLHQHLMDHYGNGLLQGNLTVDHINQNKLDNRIENLRLLTQSEQNLNQGKRKRQSTARSNLPSFIKELPKYVQYGCNRFEIINHPKSPNKNFYTTQKNDISLEDKYKQVLEILKQIDNGDYLNIQKEETEQNNNKTTEFGKHIYQSKSTEKPYFVFEFTKDDKRYNMKSSSLGINDFKERVINKYPELNDYLKKTWNIKETKSDNNINSDTESDNNNINNNSYGKYIRLGSIHNKPALIFEYRDSDKDLRLNTSSTELDINKFKQKVIEKFPVISDLLKIIWDINKKPVYNYKNYVLPLKFSLYVEREKYLTLSYSDRLTGHNKKLNLDMDVVSKEYLDDKMNELKVGLIEKYPEYNFGWDVKKIIKPVLDYKLPDDKIKVIIVKGQKLLKIDIKKDGNRYYRTMVFNDKQEEVDVFYEKNKNILI
jgi:hypothetical protein